MSTIGSILKRTFKILALTALFALSFLYLRDKADLAQIKQDTVVRRCSGAHTMISVCDCYNYYGRHCLTDKYLLWDSVPTDTDEEPSAEGLHDLQEEIKYEGAGEVNDV